MFGLKTFIAGLFLGSVTSLLAMQFHVLNTADGMIVLPRAHRPPIRSTYADVRKWSLAMWRQHPEVAEAAIKFGRADLLGDGALNSLFPRSTDTSVTPAAETAAEQTKLALEALIPIKFTSPDGQENFLDFKPATSRVPEPVLPTGSLGPLPPSQSSVDQNRTTIPPTTPSTHNFSETGSVPAAKFESVFPENFGFDESLLKGLPKLQNPIPIFDDDVADTRAATPLLHETAKPTPSSDLFTDVLRAFIPKTGSATQQRQYSVAHPAYRVEAPQPNSQLILPSEATIPGHPPAVPFVRPF